MIKARLAADALPAAVMRCEDARNSVAALIGGPIPLTEWALLESHLSRCARCRELETRLRQLVVASRPVPRSERVLAFLRKAQEIVRIRAASSAAALVVRGRTVVTALERDLTPRAAAGVTRTLDLVTRGRGELMVRMHMALATSRRAPVAAVNAVEAGRRAVSGSVQGAVRVMRWVRAVATILALALMACALQGTSGPQRALPSATLAPGVEAAPLAAWIESAHPAPPHLASAHPAPSQLAPAQPEVVQPEAVQLQTVPLPPAQPEPVTNVSALAATASVEKRPVSVAPTQSAPRRQAPLAVPPQAVAAVTPDVSTPEPTVEVPPSAASAVELPAAPSHVVGRLTAKNPRAAQRDFVALLADVGGTELGRSQRTAFTSVAVVVPQSRYDEFADGLAHIGSWQLEAARYPLPDSVQVTIRLTN